MTSRMLAPIAAAACLAAASVAFACPGKAETTSRAQQASLAAASDQSPSCSIERASKSLVAALREMDDAKQDIGRDQVRMALMTLVENRPELRAKLASDCSSPCQSTGATTAALASSKKSCSSAVKNALKIKERNPGVNVFVLYREMRTYGFREDRYREARSKGVVFLRYELPDKPQVSGNEDGLSVKLKEPITGEDVVINAGTLVLSTGIEPNDSQALADVLDVSLDENGFFQEEYPKMRPLDFTKRGIFVCGLAHSPRFSDEAIVQAEGAAMRAAALLAQQELEAPVAPVLVIERLCTACGQCVEVCPYDARVLEPGAHTAEVIEVLCQGCGACIVACPNKATRRQGAESASASPPRTRSPVSGWA